MSDTDVLRVSLDNLQNLLKKIDENQVKLFETQNQHSKDLERLNGLIEKNTSTNQLELKAIIREIQNNQEKDMALSEKVRNIETVLLKKLEDKIEKVCREAEEEDIKIIAQLNKNTIFRKKTESLVDKVDKNTRFRLNMEGFSWVRHGIPVLMLIIAIATLIYTFAH